MDPAGSARAAERSPVSAPGPARLQSVGVGRREPVGSARAGLQPSPDAQRSLLNSQRPQVPASRPTRLGCRGAAGSDAYLGLGTVVPPLPSPPLP